MKTLRQIREFDLSGMLKRGVAKAAEQGTHHSSHLSHTGSEFSDAYKELKHGDYKQAATTAVRAAADTVAPGITKAYDSAKEGKWKEAGEEAAKTATHMIATKNPAALAASTTLGTTAKADEMTPEMEKKIRDYKASGKSMVQKVQENVAVGGGDVAGLGVGAKGEPGVSPRHQPKKNKSVANPIIADMLKRRSPVMEEEHLEEETFAGAVVFEVSSKLFHNITLQKRKGKHWRTYLEEDDCYAEIREYANKNPKKKIVIRNENTGEMRYIRH